ncbi:transcription elongation factor GreA [Ensifer adhaerens]|uniref:Transcription elongation factor GreA n=1 Tax=Ensifer adhaerens TaxID=106592 RepID=A0ACC5T292_ENSAD|nr:transcription elongation factor GreA [Ensifer adhaerens]
MTMTIFKERLQVASCAKGAVDHGEKSGIGCFLSAIRTVRIFRTVPALACRRPFSFALAPPPSGASFLMKDIEMVDKVPMTQGGFVNLQEELRWRQQEERPRIIEAIAEARAHGDLSENAEYHAAKEAQSHNEGRVGELEDLIARAEVIDLSKMSGSKIKFGAKVKLVDEDTEEEKTYQIVGDQEADVKAGRISISSPIARALIGKEVGDSIEVNAPGGSKAYEILAVNWG